LQGKTDRADNSSEEDAVSSLRLSVEWIAENSLLCGLSMRKGGWYVKRILAYHMRLSGNDSGTNGETSISLTYKSVAA
jgi:hypothetical protein